MAERLDYLVAERMRITAATGARLVAASLIVLAACGRSENVGWADRDMPEGAAAESRAATSAETAEQPAAGSPEALQREYQALARALSPLQRAAMADSAVVARWEVLNADLEARLKEQSDFHRGLFERRDELEALLAAAGEGEEALSAEEQAELSGYYRNVQTELARARTAQLREPEFAGRFSVFRAFLFDKMREMDPAKTDQLNRFEQLDELLFNALVTAPPAGPGTQPDANAQRPG